jgi:hypothetical protein
MSVRRDRDAIAIDPIDEPNVIAIAPSPTCLRPPSRSSRIDLAIDRRENFLIEDDRNA